MLREKTGEGDHGWRIISGAPRVLSISDAGWEVLDYEFGIHRCVSFTAGTAVRPSFLCVPAPLREELVEFGDHCGGILKQLVGQKRGEQFFSNKFEIRNTGMRKEEYQTDLRVLRDLVSGFFVSGTARLRLKLGSATAS